MNVYIIYDLLIIVWALKYLFKNIAFSTLYVHCNYCFMVIIKTLLILLSVSLNSSTNKLVATEHTT